MYEFDIVCLTWMLFCSSSQSFLLDLTSPQSWLFCTHNWSSWIIQCILSQPVCLLELLSLLCCGPVWTPGGEDMNTFTLLSSSRQAVITHFKLGARVTENALSEHQSGPFLSSRHSVCLCIFIEQIEAGSSLSQWSSFVFLFQLLPDIILLINRREATSVLRSSDLFLDITESCLGNWFAAFRHGYKLDYLDLDRT